ncbi:MAG: hypothetical protein ACKPHU_31690, partial [Planctomycetaceae bacterium]
MSISVARAFQPEFCPLRLVRLGIAVKGRVLCRQLASREAAKRNAAGRWSVGEPRTGVRGCCVAVRLV